MKQIGRELGVRYILQGSVRKAGNRVRITGQLIDASTGAHLWANRFDGTIDDIFDLQDQVTARVVGAIAPKLEQAEIERAKHKPTESLDARETAEAERLARRAVEMGKDDALALATAGIALAFVVGDIDDGAAFIEQALILNPNLAWAWLFSGYVRTWLGEPEIAIERIAHAMRLSPQDSQFFNMQTATAEAHFVACRYTEALSWAQMAVRSYPNYVLPNSIVAAGGALAGRLAVAEGRNTLAPT